MSELTFPHIWVPNHKVVEPTRHGYDWNGFLRDHVSYRGTLELPFTDGKSRVIRPDLQSRDLLRWFSGLVNGGMVNAGHALANAGVIRAHTVYPCTIYDSFDRADSSSTAGSTETGQAYTAQSGTYGISSNALAKISANANMDYLTFDAGIANIDLSITATVMNTGVALDFSTLAFRWVDASNFLRVNFGGLACSGCCSITKFDAGVPSELANNATNFANGTKFRVVANGSSITTYFDTGGGWSSFMTATSSFNSSATVHGVAMYRTAYRYNNLCLNPA